MEIQKLLMLMEMFLNSPDMTLKTDSLFMDRINNTAFYNSKGVIIDSLATLTSNKEFIL